MIEQMRPQCNIEIRIQKHRNRQRGKGWREKTYSTLEVLFNILHKLLEKNSKQIIDFIIKYEWVMSISMGNIVHN
jgi:hypothetical protein